MNRMVDVDITPYDDRLRPLDLILEILGADLKVSSTGTSIRMYSYQYPLTNTGFINLGRASFLHNLINGAQIDIHAHIF